VAGLRRDGTNVGPWSEAVTFYVNEVNHPPAAVVQYGPANGAILYLDADLLFWRETTDVDVGDVVTTYHIQVSKTADFAAPVIDDAAIVAPPPLGSQPVEVSLAIAIGSLAGPRTCGRHGLLLADPRGGQPRRLVRVAGYAAVLPLLHHPADGVRPLAGARFLRG